MGAERRTRANAAKLKSYQQLTLPGGYGTEEGQPSVLVKRIRGTAFAERVAPAGDRAHVILA